MSKSRILPALVLLLAWGFFLRDRPGSITATINWADLRQQMDGFGGSSADFLDSLTPAQADFFFTTSGIGLSILRTQIIPDTATCDTEFHNGGCSNTNGQILNGELESAKLAVARGATVFSTPWSPPGAYKSNGSFKNGGYLFPSHYSDWAQRIAAYVSMMAKEGVPIYAVSVQNEPDLSTDYGSCKFSAEQIHDFVPYLYSALQNSGVHSTKIILPEQSSWRISLAAATMADPNTAKDVGIIAAHGYGRKVQNFHTGSARLWLTEVSSQSSVYDGSMNDGLSWAQTIHDFLTLADVNAWVWWFLTDMPRQGEGTDNAALTDINGNYPKRAYVTGQWSRFVRPGWLRIGVSNSGPLPISAFKDVEAGAFAIVVVNSTGESLSQTFTFNGFSAKSLTPWVTSASLSLAPQPPVIVADRRFTYTLPPASVTTFAGTALPTE